MELTLEQLIQNRKDLIEAHRKNDFTDGIHALLTDLYPDTAHFIYELLQNAEDMNATTVRFILEKDEIEFEHNGTKRAFNLADIDAITNIGHNGQKKDDPTSIGKFGVGFKAVFAYTATPIIHSGKHHFRIRDYFVPEFDDVPEVNTIDHEGVAWTKFIFPFNNPKKPAKVAYEECLDGLKALDTSAILFLQNIEKIEYMLPSADLGYVERIANGKNHISVICRRPAEQKDTLSRWLRFSRPVDVISDQGKKKTLSIAVAYAIEHDIRTQEDKVVPIDSGGQTFIYFPAEKEHSGLRFHINAPFASTVARDSVRDCSDNMKLIEAVSKLVVDSLVEIKAQKMMNHSFFEVLPNNRDAISPFYRCILNNIYSAFQENEYLPTKTGGFVTSLGALIGPTAISNVLKKDDMVSFFEIDKIWVQNAIQRNSNADNFIHSLNIQTFSYKDFAHMFEFLLRTKSEKYLLGKSNDWLKNFYALCADTNEALGYSESASFLHNMQETKMIRNSKGQMFKPRDIYILPKNTALITKTTPIVHQDFVIAAGKRDRKAERVLSFFRDELGVREYAPKIEVEKLLEFYDKGIEVNDQYFKDMLAFAKYQVEHDDIDFSKHEIFLYLGENGQDLFITKASKLFLGKAYGNEAGQILAEAYEKETLWNGYAEKYSKQEISRFVDFVVACGIKRELTIEEQSARYNPLYYTELKSDARHTGYGVNEDYTIQELRKLLELQSVKISRLIWGTLERYGKNSGRRYLNAKYAPNASVTAKVCDSSLVYYLKQYAWLPNKQGKLFKPEDITISNLHNSFPYDKANKLMEALNLGSSEEQQSQKLAKLEKEAEEEGMRVITAEDYRQFEQWKKQMYEKRFVTPISSQDLLSKQNKETVRSVGQNLLADGSVNNIGRRETNIENTFRNAQKMSPLQKKLFGLVKESTKEEKGMLRHWYQGRCQMCNMVIIGYNGVPHFVARNIIDTQHLTEGVRRTTNLAWNSLCLCPNCAARYKVCSRDLSGLYEQIMHQKIVESDAERIVLSIELDEKRQEIRYAPEHFLALRKMIQLIDEKA